jgi:hypothetical protein
LDHPEKFDISLKNISHLVEDLNYDKGNRCLKIKVKLLDTPAGQIAKKLVDAGVPLSISSRAAGNVGPDKKVQIKKIFTYDLVADPGFQNAQLERVYESAGFSQFDIAKMFNKKSIVEDLVCVNESLGLENNSSLKIYKVENNEEFNKIINTGEKNTKTLMENKEFVTAEELNKYSLFLKKEMDSMKSVIDELKDQKETTVSESEENKPSYSELEERVAKLEKYSDYLAENLENSVKYGEYLAENLDNSIGYAKYLAENLDRSISYAKYLSENLDKSISYSEYVAESVDNSIEYSKYLAEKLDQSIQYSDYLAENVENNIEYSEYIGENLDKSIGYAEYVAENVTKNIQYSEYIGESLEKAISYTEYVAESLNKNVDNLEELNEKITKNISYTEYVAESVNQELGNSDQTKHLKESIETSNKFGSEKIDFSVKYEDLENRIDSLINTVKTQKTVINENQSSKEAETQRAETNLNESMGFKKVYETGMAFIDYMPEQYSSIWESLSEGHKQSIIAQSSFFRLETPYQIRNFWSSRQLGAEPIGLQRINENETKIEDSESKVNIYGNSYMDMIAKQLEIRNLNTKK